MRLEVFAVYLGGEPGFLEVQLTTELRYRAVPSMSVPAHVSAESSLTRLPPETTRAEGRVALAVRPQSQSGASSVSHWSPAGS